MRLPRRVTVVDVSPRDGLQSEQIPVPTGKKIELIKKLISAGISKIEVTSFVSPKWIPQLADAEELLAGIAGCEKVTFQVLIPNERGYERARRTGLIADIMLVVAATESLNRKNVNMSVADSMRQFAVVVERAKEDGVRVRGTVAVAFFCPYDGSVPPEQSLKLAGEFFRLGADEVAFADSLGRATPDKVYRLFTEAKDRWPDKVFAGHFHDTYRMALANVFAAMQAGAETFDSSVGGLGGCPFVKGARGNVATEDLVFMLAEMGIETDIDYERLLAASRFAQGLVRSSN